jgi:hypothetical protein
MIVEFDKEDEASIDNALQHYKKCVDMLRDLIDNKGALREGSIIEDIWDWKQ